MLIIFNTPKLQILKNENHWYIIYLHMSLIRNPCRLPEGTIVSIFKINSSLYKNSKLET